MKNQNIKKPTLLIILFLLINQTNAQWLQVGSDFEGDVANNQSGNSVSLSSDGTILAIGAKDNDDNGINSGNVKIYKYTGNNWTQMGNNIEGEVAGDQFGFSVSLSSDGTIVAIGAKDNDGNGENAGHVRVYKYAGNSWTQMGNDIEGEGANDRSGFSVSLSSDGSIVAIGAKDNDGNGENAGHVRVYKYVNDNWTQIGSDIDGEDAGDQSGASVSLNSNGLTVAIGSPYNTGDSIYTGQVRVYSYNGSNWIKTGNDIEGKLFHEGMGRSVSLSSDGLILAVGAFQVNSPKFNRHCRIYKLSGGVWAQIGNDITGSSSGGSSESGISVDLSSNGSIVVIGEESRSTVRIFKEYNGNWSQIGDKLNGSYAGTSVCLNSKGSIVAYGAIHGGTQNSGLIRVYTAGNTTASISSSSCTSYTSPSGKIWTTSGNYIDTIPNNIGFDSIISIHLTISSPKNTFENISICSGENYTFPQGNTVFNITSKLVQTSTLASINGCDSIIETTLNINPVYNLTENISILSGDDYTFPDGTKQTNITNQVSHTSKLKSIYGCDSIIETTVDIDLVYTSYESVNVCYAKDYKFPDGSTISHITNNMNYSSKLKSVKGNDSIINTKINVISNSGASLNVTKCNGYLSPSGKIWTKSGVYNDTIINHAGCDSVIIIGLHLINDTINISIKDGTLTSDIHGVNYQWVDCNNNMTPIYEETKRSFTPVNNGKYALIVSSETCQNISACYNVELTSVDKNKMSSIKVFPNPTTGRLVIQGENIEQISVLNITGQNIELIETNSENNIIDLSMQPKGIYFVKVKRDTDFYIEKIILE